jgi:hypothetical protein
MRALVRSLVFCSAAITHALIVHALVSLHASCAYAYCTSGGRPVGAQSGTVEQSVYHIMFVEFDALFFGLFLRQPFPTDTPARIRELGAHPIGSAGACLPTDALTLGTLLLMLCVGYGVLHTVTYTEASRRRVSRSLACASHAVGWLLGLCSCGVSLALVLATDSGALWPTRTGPFLPPRDIAISVTVSSAFFVLGVLTVELHAVRWHQYSSRALCRCGHDLSGVAHVRCPECGTDLGSV